MSSKKPNNFIANLMISYILRNVKVDGMANKDIFHVLLEKLVKWFISVIWQKMLFF